MQPLSLTPARATEALRATHGIDAESLTPLGSELSSTFRARAGSELLAVKMQPTDAAELPVQRWRAGVAELLHDAGHPIPALRGALDGSAVGVRQGDPGPVAVTVSEWVDALPYGELPVPGGFGRSLGLAAGRMQADLARAPRPPHEIDHTWAAHTTPATIAGHLDRVTDDGLREIARIALQLHTTLVAPVETELPRALVHQDLHDSNVLAHPDGSIAAIIDFDDMLVGWRVAEPAIAAAYLSRHTREPTAAVAEVAEGWETEVPFTAAERQAYLPVVLARLALNAVVWHTRLGDDDRSAYARMRSQGSEAAFRALLALTPARPIDEWE